MQCRSGRGGDDDRIVAGVRKGHTAMGCRGDAGVDIAAGTERRNRCTQAALALESPARILGVDGYGLNDMILALHRFAEHAGT